MRTSKTGCISEHRFIRNPFLTPHCSLRTYGSVRAGVVHSFGRSVSATVLDKVANTYASLDSKDSILDERVSRLQVYTEESDMFEIKKILME